MASETAAEYIHQLMTEVLGYKNFYVHGSDYGAFIGEKLALKYPESVKGLHLSDIPFYHFYAPHENLSQVEKDHLQKINDGSMQDGAYAIIQSTKPKTLSTGLNDSPAALAAWLLRLYFDFGDKELPIGKVAVPAAFNFHEYDITGFVPREFAERFFSNIVFWTAFNEGGHFAGLSHPRQLKNDLIPFIENVEQNRDR